MRYIVHNHFPTRDVELDQEFVDAWKQARSIDPMRYMDGLKKLTFVPDFDKWNASYQPELDEIVVRAKFHKKTFMDKVQTLLHEGGHRGQMLVDKDAFKRMKSAGLITVESFLAMANQVHQDDFRENGIGKAELADEVFAESYARFSLGMEMPTGLRQFWQERTSR